MFADVKNSTGDVSRLLRRRYEFCSECDAGSLSEVRTPIEKFNQKVSSYSCGYDIILCLRIGGVGFSLLGGITLGVHCEVVRAAEGGSVDILPLFVHRGLVKEGSWLKHSHRHGSKMWLP